MRQASCVGSAGRKKKQLGMRFLIFLITAYKVYILQWGGWMVIICLCYQDYYGLNLDIVNLVLPPVCFRTEENILNILIRPMVSAH